MGKYSARGSDALWRGDRQAKARDYSEINPVDAREHFIHGGLVERSIEGHYPFLEHNQRELDAVEALEAKARKRDLLVESRWIFDFYDERLPKQILSETELKTHLKRDKRLDAALRFDRKDIMRRAASVSAEAFPTVFRLARMHYRSIMNLTQPLTLMVSQSIFRSRFLIRFPRNSWIGWCLVLLVKNACVDSLITEVVETQLFARRWLKRYCRRWISPKGP